MFIRIFILVLIMTNIHFSHMDAQDQALIFKSQLEVFELATQERKIIYSEEGHFEAPNWSPDGQYFIINSEGHLYKVSLGGQSKELIDTDFADRCNNDHGISPDGKLLVISHNDPTVPHPELQGYQTSRIYTLPISGGQPKVITPLTPSYWHGWSPDGKELAYVGFRDGEYDIYIIPANGGEETKLTNASGLQDGPDYSPDGKHIYYNSFQTGSMEIWRMRVDGSSPEQLTNDDYSNWFPHPSPDGKGFVFLSYLEDQGEAHPAMKEVELRYYNFATKEARLVISF
ncbi:MAG: transporter, partial [Bacteroidota bacterium]